MIYIISIFSVILDFVRFFGLLPYPLVGNTEITVNCCFEEGNVVQFIIPLNPNDMLFEGLLRSSLYFNLFSDFSSLPVAL